MQKDYDRLVAAAIEARENAYAPYSGFAVGAALEDENGRQYTGCNVENVSYGATCCAERTAIFKAISEGSRKIDRLAVVCGQDDYCLPCGICRQVMAEFATEDFVLLAAKPDGKYRVLTFAEILPNAFLPGTLLSKDFKE